MGRRDACPTADARTSPAFVATTRGCMNAIFQLDTTKYLTDFVAFFPELLICCAIVLMLFLRVFKAFKGLHMGGLALVFTLFALVISVMQWLEVPGMQGLFHKLQDLGHTGQATPVQEMFGGLLIFDHFTVFMRMFLYGFTSLIIWLTMAT